jgi:hypothetical protein
MDEQSEDVSVPGRLWRKLDIQTLQRVKTLPVKNTAANLRVRDRSHWPWQAWSQPIRQPNAELEPGWFYIRRSRLNLHAYLFVLDLFELTNPLWCGSVLRGLET